MSQRVVTPDGIRPAALLVDGEKIRAVIAPSEIPADAPVTDFGNAAILPGLIDPHVHINEPGRTEWEGFRTATRAAAAGGFTMLVDMPLNCLPATTSVAALEQKRDCAWRSSLTDWLFWGGVVHDNQAAIAPLAAAGVPGFKCFLVHPGIEGFTMVTEAQLRVALPHVARAGLPLLVHAELPGPVDAATLELTDANWRRYDTYLRSRPDEAELSAMRLLIALCREYQFRLHIVHLSTAQALPMIVAARTEGLPITAETCPHHLHFTAEEIPDGSTVHKCAPPIRSSENREQLWGALREGVIDLVATDHSPCPPEMKHLDTGDFRSAWGGISSLSVALPVMWAEASGRGFTLRDIAKWMSEVPARLAGCSERKGRLAAGLDADFVVFDPETEITVSRDRLYHRHCVSPYLGERVRGVVLKTFLRGRCIFRDGTFPGNPGGSECKA